jgi:hypothetical protein
MVTHPAPPQTRTCAMHAYGSSSSAAAAPGAVHWAAVVRVGARNVSPLFPASGCSARRRLPSRGSRGPPFPTCVGTLRRDDCPLSRSGRFACRSRPDPWRACMVRGLPHGLGTAGNAPRSPPGLVVPRSPPPGLASRRPVALPRSRVPPVQTCPALRPRWGPAHAPSRAQDCGLPVRANRRLTTTLPIAGLPHAAGLLAPPGFVRPLTGRHAGALLPCWRSFRQVGLAPHRAHPLGNTNQFRGFSPIPKVSGFPWREHAVARARCPAWKSFVPTKTRRCSWAQPSLRTPCRMMPLGASWSASMTWAR